MSEDMALADIIAIFEKACDSEEVVVRRAIPWGMEGRYPGELKNAMRGAIFLLQRAGE